MSLMSIFNEHSGIAVTDLEDHRPAVVGEGG
jgi:hypothetical protein